ncbi:hypothetical protein LOZ53_001535 [Ophidiomyces ophidiicola]|nr:hypothetical protein LOZ53_001535 [Ophidiomyces ophidiicola]
MLGYKSIIALVFLFWASPIIASLTPKPPSPQPKPSSPRLPDLPETKPVLKSGDVCDKWKEAYSFSEYTWMKYRACFRREDDLVKIVFEVGDAQYYWGLEWYRFGVEHGIFVHVQGEAASETTDLIKFDVKNLFNEPGEMDVAKIKTEKDTKFSTTLVIDTAGPYWDDIASKIIESIAFEADVPIQGR